MEYFRGLLQPLCPEPILGLSYLFARGSILDWSLHAVAGNISSPVPVDAVADEIRQAHQKRAGGRSQALCAVTESRITVVGVAPAPDTVIGRVPDFFRLTVATDPVIFERAGVDVQVDRRLLTRRLTLTDRTTKRRYEFEIHVAGTGDFTDAFFAALDSYLRA